MAFREIGAWITLVTTVCVYGAYYAIVGHDLLRPGGPELGFVAPLSAAIAAIVALQIGLNVVAAVASPADARAPKDERERLIELRSTRAAFYTLQVGAFAAIVVLFWGADVKLMANGVFLAIVAAEVARSLWQVIDYRRAAA